MLSCDHTFQAFRKKNHKKVQNTCELTYGGKSTPALTNGNEDTVPGSKYQQKKAKKQAKKQAKVN